MNLFKGLLGAGMGFLTGGPAGAAIGGIGGLTEDGKPAQRTNQNAAQAAQNQQQLTGVGNQLLQRYQSAAPQERSILDYFYNRAGLGSQGNAQNGVGPGGIASLFGGRTGAPMGTAPGVNGGQPFAAWGSRRTLPGFQPTPPPGDGMGGALGIWNSPQYRLLRQQAEESVGHDMQNNQNSFNGMMAGRGIDQSSVQQGGQAAITAGANKSYADFTRQLAISAADKQDQLANQALGSMQGALGSAGQAGQMFSGAAGLGLQGQGLNQAQQNQNSSALGSAIGAAANYWALGKHGGGDPIGAIGGITDGNASNDTPAPGNGAANGPFLPHDAHGGVVQAGQPVVVGDGHGPETFMSDSFGPGAPVDPMDPASRAMQYLVNQQYLAQPTPQAADVNSVADQVLRGLANVPAAVSTGWDAANYATAQSLYSVLGGQTPQRFDSAPDYDAYRHTLSSLTGIPPWVAPGPSMEVYQRIGHGGPVWSGQMAPDPGQAELNMNRHWDPAVLNPVHAAFQRYLIARSGHTPAGFIGPPFPGNLPAGIAGPVLPLGGAHPLPHRAAGGPVSQGNAYLVGEGSGPETYVVGQQGPQVFVPPADGVILPAAGDAPAHPLIGYLTALQGLRSKGMC